MTDQTTGLDIAIGRIQGVLGEIAVDGFDDADLADALLALSLTVAEKLANPRTIARVHLGLAEKYFDRAAKAEPLGATTAASDSQAILTTAVQALRQRGHADCVIRRQMLGFAAAWVRQEEGPAGAEMLYRHADALVAAREATKPH